MDATHRTMNWGVNMGKADDLVRAWILKEVRDTTPGRDRENTLTLHIVTCPSLRVVDFEGGDGFYGCETGCEFVRLYANLACEHETGKYFYGNFGDMSWIIDGLDELKQDEEYSWWNFDWSENDGDVL